MMKWFRKYNRHLMAGLVVVLMISFLIQDAITRRDQRRQLGDWGRLRGQMLKTDARDGATQTQFILESLGVDWRQPWYRLLPQLSPEMFIRAGMTPPAPLTADTFALLWIEARDAKLHEPTDSGRTYLAQREMPDALINRVLDQRNLRQDDLYAEVAKYVRILRLSRLAMDAVRVSEEQVRRRVRDTQETVSIAYVAFPAERFVDEKYLPPEAELETQFNKYRDAAKPKDESGFGYRWPRRVRIETLAIRIDDVKPSITIPEDEARAYYRQNRGTYTRIEMAATAPASRPASSAAASAPASAAASGPVVRQLTFGEARPQVEDVLRSKRAQSRVREFMDQIESDLSAPWNSQARGPDGYLTRPAGVDAAGYMEQAAKRFSDQFGVKAVYEKSALLTERQLTTDKKWNTFVGGMERGQPMSLAGAVFRVPPFFDAKGASETAMRLALYQPCDIVFFDEDETGQARSARIVRVVESREAEPPKSLAEVRDDVLADLRAVRADAQAERMAERLYAAARGAGLKPALEADPQLKQMLEPKPANVAMPAPPAELLVEPEPFARRERSPLVDEPAQVPGFGGSASAVEACFEMGAAGWQSPPATQPAATQPRAAATQPSPKVRIVRIPETRSRLVVELNELKPVHQDEFESSREVAHMMMQYARQLVILRDWYDAPAIMKRVGFEPAHSAAPSSPTVGEEE